MTTTAREFANRHAGVIEAPSAGSVAPGMILRTVPDRAQFEVQKLSEGALVLLFGKKRTRTAIPWPCLESVMRLLVKGGLDRKSGRSMTSRGCRGPWMATSSRTADRPRTTGGYVAAVLEAARVVEVDLNRPARIRISKDIGGDGRPPPSGGRVSEEGAAEPFSRVYGALERVRSQLSPGRI